MKKRIKDSPQLFLVRAKQPFNPGSTPAVDYRKYLEPTFLRRGGVVRWIESRAPVVNIREKRKVKL